jgi:hypothetical protein
MNIEISANEYRDLLDILHIADVVMSGHRREEDNRTVAHRALIQKLYALSAGEGAEPLISYSKSAHSYVPTPEFEAGTVSHKVVDEFADHLFWDGLISRLSFRDAAEIVGGKDRLNAMSDRDRREAEGPIRQRYIEEFSKHGIDNLAVIQRFDVGEGMTVKTSD